MIEALNQNKTYIYPKYMHKGEMIYEQFGACWNAPSNNYFRIDATGNPHIQCERDKSKVSSYAACPTVGRAHAEFQIIGARSSGSRALAVGVREICVPYA